MPTSQAHRPVDRHSPLPLWAQVEADLTRRITAGTFSGGFPTESDLCTDYGVSRHTVREALRRLRTSGTLESARGRGTRVAEHDVEQSLGTLYSLFRSVEDRGMTQTSTVLRLAATTDPRAAVELHQPADTPLVVLERVRHAEGKPLAHDTVFLPPHRGRTPAGRRLHPRRPLRRARPALRDPAHQRAGTHHRDTRYRRAERPARRRGQPEAAPSPTPPGGRHGVAPSPCHTICVVGTFHRSHHAVPGLYFYDNDVQDVAVGLVPSSPRGELEITDVNRHYLQTGHLAVEVLPRRTAWLDTGTTDSLLDAGTYVSTVDQRTGLMLGVPEEVAWRRGLLTDDALAVRARSLVKSERVRRPTCCRC